MQLVSDQSSVFFVRKQMFKHSKSKSSSGTSKIWSPRYIHLHPSIPRNIKQLLPIHFSDQSHGRNHWNDIYVPHEKLYSRRWDLLSPSPSLHSFLSSVSQSRRFSFHFLFCRIASVEAVSFISIISGTFLVSLPFFRAPMDRLARIAVGSNISNYIPVRNVESLVGPLGFLFSPKQHLRTVYTLVLPFQPRKVFFSYSLWLVREKRRLSRKKKNLLQSAIIESFSLSHRLLAGVG